jgi:hypothetical protein
MRIVEIRHRYQYNDVPLPFILQNKICDFFMLIYIFLQEHNELIQGIILKNRHLKDIIGKKQTLSNYDQILFVLILICRFFIAIRKFCYQKIWN